MAKKTSITGLVTELRKKFGHEAAVLLGDRRFHSDARYGISTQSLALDFAIGRTGLPSGRVVEISGLDGHGKSTFGEHLLAETQRLGGIACLIETEHGRDTHRMTKEIGVDPERLVVLQPLYLEDGFTMIEELIHKVRRADATIPFTILWDSIAQTQTKEEHHDKYDEAHVGMHARVIAQALRKLLPLFASHEVLVVFINQLKRNIGAYGFAADKWVTFGGKAISYAASVALRVRRFKEEFNAAKTSSKGFIARVRVEKNKLGVPKRTVDVPIVYKTGIDRAEDLWMTAVQFKLFPFDSRDVIRLSKSLTLTKKDWPSFVNKHGIETIAATFRQRAYRLQLIQSYHGDLYV